MHRWGGERGSPFLIFGEKTSRQFSSGRGASPPSASASPSPALTPSCGISTSTPRTVHSWPRPGCQPRQRDPRCSLSSTRPSAQSSPSASPRRGRGSRGANPRSAPRTLGAPDKCAAHPHGSPQMSRVIPLPIIQTLKSDRCKSNVFRVRRKLTKGNYVRVFGEERLPLATTPPSHRWGLPGTAPPPLTRAASPASTIVRAIRRAM